MFYREFYRKEIPVNRAVEALDAWLQEHLSITEDLNPEVVVNSDHGLQFVPAFETLVPHVASIVEFHGIKADYCRVVLEIHTGKWNTESWEEVIRKEHLPQLFGEFFGIVDSKEDLIVPVIGLFKAQFMRHKNPRRLISYPPCTCKGCDSPICPVRRRGRRR